MLRAVFLALTVVTLAACGGDHCPDAITTPGHITFANGADAHGADRGRRAGARGRAHERDVAARERRDGVPVRRSPPTRRSG